MNLSSRDREKRIIRETPAFEFDLPQRYADSPAWQDADRLTIPEPLGHSHARITARHYADLADQTAPDAVAMHCGSKPVGDLAAAFVSVVLLIPARCATMSLYERVSPPGCYHQQSIDNILPRIKSMQENVSRNPNQWHSRRRNSVSEASKEDAVLAVLADRLVEERLPRALALKEKVGRGEVLDDFDIAFLEQVLADARNIPQGIKDNPTFKDAAAQMMQLYNAIMSKALENEQAQKSS